MSFLVLALLVGLWLAILLPGAVRAHRASSPRSTVEAFRRTMERLSTRPDAFADAPADVADEADVASGTEARQPSARQLTLARRRTVVCVLMGGLVASGTGAAVAGPGMLWWLLVADAVALAVYLGLLLALRTRVEEARRKVAPLPARPPSPSPPPPDSTEAVSLRAAAGEHA